MKKKDIDALIALIKEAPSTDEPPPLPNEEIEPGRHPQAVSQDTDAFIVEHGVESGPCKVELSDIYRVYVRWSKDPDSYKKFAMTFRRYFVSPENSSSGRKRYYLSEANHKSAEELVKEIGIKVYERKEEFKKKSRRVSRLREKRQRKESA